MNLFKKPKVGPLKTGEGITDLPPPKEIHEVSAPIFTKDKLPSFVKAGSYRKKVATRALRIAGPFSIDMGEKYIKKEKLHLAKAFNFPAK